MITGVHTMFYTSQAEDMRAFLRDKLGFSFTDTGDGWLIFNMPRTEMGVHPVNYDGAPPTGTRDVSFICDDVNATVADLKAKGVEFVGEVEDRGYGMCINFKMPGGFEAELYQPKYKL